jgi:hypothetical protein
MRQRIIDEEGWHMDSSCSNQDLFFPNAENIELFSEGILLASGLAQGLVVVNVS